jgi:MoaA/NifB/PqqE/SkfB family radical SAM enzyme
MNHLDTLCVELTLRCPLRCVHCSANAAPERVETLDPDLLLKRVRELAPLEEIYLSGGEPFEHPSLARIARDTSLLASQVAIYSSGVVGTTQIDALPTDVLGKLVRSVTRVDVSLYGLSASEHDAVTLTPGSFDSTLESIRRLRVVGIPLGIHFVPVSGGEDVLALAQFAREVGARRFHVLAVAAQGRAQTLNVNYSERFLDKLRLLSTLDFGVEIVISSDLRARLGLGATKRDSLSAAFVDVNGHLYPSEGKRSPGTRSLGTLHRSGFSDLASQINVQS